jgi:hypothetical protein
METVLQAPDKFLIAINELGQATFPLLSEWLGLHPEYVKKMMYRLKADSDDSPGFVRVLHVKSRDYQQKGSVPEVFTLSHEGREYLRMQKIDVPERFKQSELVARPHTLAVNQVLTKARVLERSYPYLMLYDYKHESELMQKPMLIPVSPHKTVGLKPDLWLDFRGKSGGRKCFLFEINLRRVTESLWREKILAYLNCVPVYQEYFGTDIIQIVVICATRENFPPRLSRFASREEARAIRKPQAVERWKRLKNLMRWTEQELKANHAEYMADLFLFSDHALDRATPEELFFKPYYLMPFSPYPRSLMKPKQEVTHA